MRSRSLYGAISPRPVPPRPTSEMPWTDDGSTSRSETKSQASRTIWS
jgi:hypothetical protein